MRPKSKIAAPTPALLRWDVDPTILVDAFGHVRNLPHNSPFISDVKYIFLESRVIAVVTAYRARASVRSALSVKEVHGVLSRPLALLPALPNTPDKTL